MRNKREVPKNCTLCKHFEFDAGWGGSDVTPGDPASMDCRLEKVSFHLGMYAGEDALRSVFLTADSCADFKWFDESDTLSAADGTSEPDSHSNEGRK